MTLSQTLALLSPELVLVVAGLVVLALDLIWRDEEKKEWLPYVALAGLAGALAAVVALWGREWCSLPAGSKSTPSYAHRIGQSTRHLSFAPVADCRSASSVFPQESHS